MSEMTATKQRPKYLALNEIRQPLPAIVSILHRISGAGLFLMLPLLLSLFGDSLGTREQFADYKATVDNAFVKLILLGLLWAYLHHFSAGIRHLLLDLRIGDDLQPSRQSARIVVIVSLVLTVIIGVKLW